MKRAGGRKEGRCLWLEVIHPFATAAGRCEKNMCNIYFHLSKESFKTALLHISIPVIKQIRKDRETMTFDREKKTICLDTSNGSLPYQNDGTETEEIEKGCGGRRQQNGSPTKVYTHCICPHFASFLCFPFLSASLVAQHFTPVCWLLSRWVVVSN